MKVILKTREGYINTNNGIKICREKKEATLFNLSDISDQKKKIYKEKPMIGKIMSEVVR